MIITHDIPWNDCLSKQLFPAIKKGWKDENTPIHFFWGLGGQNIKGIRECMEKKEQWYYVDVGYFTQQITRYPTPKIHDYDKTYFRIVKGNLHTIRGKTGNGARVTELERKGIDVKFKGWNTHDCDHILLCPSSPTVTYHINGITQEEWIQQVTDEIKKHTDMKIIVRQKPRPNNSEWGTDIKDRLGMTHCIVTNMSLAAIDGIMNRVPVICHQQNVACFVSGRSLKHIKKPMRPGRKTIDTWIKMVVENQFTIDEIERGLACKILKQQDV
jgi:hypothetical protein